MPAPLTAAAVTAREPSLLGGVGFAALGFGLLTVMDTIVKWLSSGYSLAQIIFINSAVALVPILVVTFASGGLVRLRTRRPLLHLTRGLLSLVSAFGAFFAYSRLAIADAYSVIFSAPLLITALSVPILKESVGWRRWTACAVGFCGLLIILQPGAGVFDIGVLGALTAALCYSGSVMTIRIGSVSETSSAFAFWTSIVAVVVTGAMLPFGFRWPPAGDLVLFVAMGTLAGLGAVLIVLAYRRAHAAIVAPFQYTQLLWGAILGYLVFGDLPATATYIGGSLIVASGLYIIWREARLAIDRRRRTDPIEPAAPAA